MSAIKVEERKKFGSAESRRLRRSGRIPAVLYGKGRDPVHCVLTERDVERLLREHEQFVTLQLGGREESALVREVQFDALGDRVLHLDFLRISKEEEVEVPVRLHVVGTSKAEGHGGHIELQLAEVPVRCKPDRIPEAIRLDVSELDTGDLVRVADLDLPEGVRAAVPDDQVVLVCKGATVEEEVEEGVEPSEPEVIGKGGQTGEESQED